MNQKILNETVKLLQSIITTPSLSGNENKTADIIDHYLNKEGIKTRRVHNNIFAFNDSFEEDKPTLLLNSHHDTVQPNASWIRNPYKADIEGGKLFGLGSNDAGASLVTLITMFVQFYKYKNLRYNLILAATAEEESSGEKGIRSVLPQLGKIDLAIVGEPTGMNMAIAEKGLIVLRCEAKGVSGHAARNVGENAILKAIEDIQWFSNYCFPKESESLGPVKMTVTMIKAGTQHNVIPDKCNFTVDIRTIDSYTHEEILAVIKENTNSSYGNPSLSLSPSSIPSEHPLVRTAQSLGIKTFGSPTLSDQTFIPAASVKMGPGMSERSHTADEFVYLEEIQLGLKTYSELLSRFLMN
jgi:acetylornithine deacetylase